MNKRQQISTILLVTAILAIIASGCKKNEEEELPVIKDGDGNIYQTLTIGTQVWLKENLKTTKYNDGAAIPNVTNNTEWGNLTSGAYCWYDNDEATYKNTYGALYNWYTTNTGKLCPVGYRIPSHAEWTTLSEFLGGSGLAGGMLKEAGTTHWMTPNTDATNEKGFTALPGGSRNTNGTFYGIKTDGYWWSTEYNATYGWIRWMRYNSSSMSQENINKIQGFSVRCIKI